MKDLHLTTAGELVDFLEQYIKIYGNPTTQEQWAECMKCMAQEGKAEHLGTTTMSAGYIAGSLRDEGIDAKKLNLGEQG